MAREIPKASKVRTTRYESFRGVDFTNDPTNVWYRRSPDAVNMLPDESGRPFKRHGWEVLLSNADICTALSKPSCSINKCAYFELAGVDHIVIFTDEGVVFYNGDENATSYTTVGVTAISTEYDCYSGYDRCFFFEGAGMSAFYVYGNLNVWRYSYDNGAFVLESTADTVDPLEVTIPTVLIGASARCTGTVYQGYNLLGTKARVEYNDIQLFEWWNSGSITVTVKEEDFKTAHPYTSSSPAYYRWKWSGSAWTTVSGGLAYPSSLIDIVGTPQTNDEIIVVYCYGVMLPNNVSQNQLSDVKAWASKKTQFDFELEVVGETGSEMWAMLHTDDIVHENPRAWIDFVDNWQEIVSGEDFIRVEFPSVKIDVTTFTNEVSTTTSANLVGA